MARSKHTLPECRYVYFIEAVGLGRLKIGIATNPRVRLYELQTGSPVELRLRSVIKTDSAPEWERELHARFAPDRLRGEWFTMTDELRDFADAWFQLDDEVTFLWRADMTPGIRFERYAGESSRRFADRVAKFGVLTGRLEAA